MNTKKSSIAKNCSSIFSNTCRRKKGLGSDLQPQHASVSTISQKIVSKIHINQQYGSLLKEKKMLEYAEWLPNCILTNWKGFIEKDWHERAPLVKITIWLNMDISIGTFGWRAITNRRGIRITDMELVNFLR